MMPRCFGGVGDGGVEDGGVEDGWAWWAGGAIFSNVKAGISDPLFVELKRSLNLPQPCLVVACSR